MPTARPVNAMACSCFPRLAFERSGSVQCRAAVPSSSWSNLRAVEDHETSPRRVRHASAREAERQPWASDARGIGGGAGSRESGGAFRRCR